jgi:hypothetical protein
LLDEVRDVDGVLNSRKINNFCLLMWCHDVDGGRDLVFFVFLDLCETRHLCGRLLRQLLVEESALFTHCAISLTPEPADSRCVVKTTARDVNAVFAKLAGSNFLAVDWIH